MYKFMTVNLVSILCVPTISENMTFASETSVFNSLSRRLLLNGSFDYPSDRFL